MKGRGSLTDFSKRGPYRAGARETYCGPDWLQRLLGNPYFLPFCMHITYLDLDSTLLSPDDYADLREFQYVDTVHVVGRLNAALADSLSSLKRLTMLDGEVRTYGGYPGATRPKSLVSVAELPQLKRLPRLKTLRLGFCELAPADVPFLAELPCIERLQICNSDLLIEDLEPLTKCRTLATLDADISATREEQQTFSARHPNLEVHWPKMEPYVPGAMQPGEQITPADVAAVLFEHWRIADGVLEPVQVFDPFPSTLSYEQMMRTREETWQIRGLDFSQLRLSRQRLQRIPIKAFPDVTGITFGVVDSADTVLELIRRCGQLSELDARHVALTKHDLDKLHLLPEASVSLQQGTLTADDICEFAQKVKPSMLNIFASSFGREEVQRVMNVNGVTMFVYKGLEEDDRDRLDLILDDDLPNNPFR
jgi:hypothetical protein